MLAWAVYRAFVLGLLSIECMHVSYLCGRADTGSWGGLLPLCGVSPSTPVASHIMLIVLPLSISPSPAPPTSVSV